MRPSRSAMTMANRGHNRPSDDRVHPGLEQSPVWGIVSGMKLARLTIPGPTTAPPALRRMRLVATALLVAMAAVYLVARALGDRHPVWGFVRAFAEAAMVGGLADW